MLTVKAVASDRNAINNNVFSGTGQEWALTVM